MVRWCMAWLMLAGLGVAADNEAALTGTNLVMGVPAGWTRRIDAHGATVAFRDPQSLAGLSAVVSEPTDLGPAGFAKQCLDELQGGCAGFTVLDSGFGYHMGSLTWSHVHYRLRLGTVIFDQVTYITVSDGRGVVITGSALSEAMPALLPVFERIALSAGLSRPTLGR